MEKYFVSIEHSCDPDYLLFEDDRVIVIRKRRLIIFSSIVKGFGSYDEDIKEFAREYCTRLNNQMKSE
ncbi:MAG: hypothetical protein ACK5KL_11605 [Dysgonomonas sp.]|jgi:hypothetical protein|nr:hypothetical protein [Prevotella sp.]